MKKSFLLLLSIYSLILFGCSSSTNVYQDFSNDEYRYEETEYFYFRYSYETNPQELFQGSTIKYSIQEMANKGTKIFSPLSKKDYTLKTTYYCFQVGNPEWKVPVSDEEFELLKLLSNKILISDELGVRERFLLKVFDCASENSIEYDTLLDVIRGDCNAVNYESFNTYLRYVTLEETLQQFGQPLGFRFIYDNKSKEMLIYMKFEYMGKDFLFFNSAILSIDGELQYFEPLIPDRKVNSGYVVENVFIPLDQKLVESFEGIQKNKEVELLLRLNGKEYYVDYILKGTQKEGIITLINLWNEFTHTNP